MGAQVTNALFPGHLDVLQPHVNRLTAYPSSMPANFTRRRDLFLDAGFKDPDAVLTSLAAEVSAVAQGAWDARDPAVRSALQARVARLPPEQLRLAKLLPEWLSARAGDLATALWLAREEHGAALELPGFLFAVLLALPEPEALAFARFMLDVEFDWQRVYADRSLAYEFLREREPNPLVWRLLAEMEKRGERLKVLELGCGIGNDAFGFLRSPRVDAYLGIDVSQEALDGFAARAAREQLRVTPKLLQGDFFTTLTSNPQLFEGANVVYSYSSLHYFNSQELARLYALVRSLLPASRGYFAFGIKGHGSVWEGQGLPLYRPDVWVNLDGQSRWFPSREALQRQLDQAGFEIRFHEMHDHWGYSELGRRDVFHFVLCSPRA
jgi:SAM-dependent methyltransferase